MTKVKRLNFRISEEVDGIIRKKAKEANMSITDYVITAALERESENFGSFRKQNMRSEPS